MTMCSKGGCGAVVGDDGYCTRCGTAAKPPTTYQPTMRQPTRRPVTSEIGTGGLPGLPIRPPETSRGDHLPPVLDDPQVPEHKRFCPNPACRHEVGRSRKGRPGRAEGFCPQCRTRFSFRPPLLPGVLVGDGQFQVEGAIAHGGLGWIYRAWDCKVQRWVVLKGLIDPDDPDKHQAAIAELAALADASHPNIVTVHTVVTHPHPLTGRDVDYIVMECLSGKSLKQLRQERSASDPYLPVEQVCRFALEVLAALKYLHEERRLLYCDLSSDNVIHSTSGVKLVDLGAVRRIDDQDSPVWGKPGFQDPKIATSGPSVATDLYTVARMMAVLSFPFPGFSTDRQGTLPGADEVPLLDRHPSFAGLLSRATHPDPQRRFASAVDMAEQLKRVLREVCAAQEGKEFPGESTRFGPELRVAGAAPNTFLAGKLDFSAAALALPDPQVDLADRHAGLLAAISAESPDETERVLTALTDPSLETRLRVVRARIELRNPAVGGDLDALAQQQPGDWRVDWFRGLRSLVDGKVEPARQAFTAVFDALPGEAAPKLALALCAAPHDPKLAERWYGLVWQTDQSYVSAAFGLARARLDADLAGAVGALEAVPDTSRYFVTARLCAILARTRGWADGNPPLADFFTAAEQLNTLELDEQQRERAIAEVLETVLSWDRAGRPCPHPTTTPVPDVLFGYPLTEHGVRDGLETVYRNLARRAATRAERITYVDKANDRRNRSWV
jgi:serine/threonine-protein kinase PknG